MQSFNIINQTLSTHSIEIFDSQVHSRFNEEQKTVGRKFFRHEIGDRYSEHRINQYCRRGSRQTNREPSHLGLILFVLICEGESPLFDLVINIACSFRRRVRLVKQNLENMKLKKIKSSDVIITIR